MAGMARRTIHRPATKRDVAEMSAYLGGRVGALEERVDRIEETQKQHGEILEHHGEILERMDRTLSQINDRLFDRGGLFDFSVLRERSKESRESAFTDESTFQAK